ncbi:hypothetical protein [Herminiimonas contaminans]|uniref:Bacteriophage Rz lysis protein n=1 Tax=Herminiimonas contaminans TaxID=1111140 RepID=A0ABS0EUY5_9BURK|nr:hypothetical protein [Herminiimonas contaminans]MBF8177647.1 hypothetical protein [Herminiimonas contaminans]
MSLLNPKFWFAIVLWTVAIGGGFYLYGNAAGKNSVLVGTLTATNKALTDRIKENTIVADRLNNEAKKASEDHAKELEAVKRTANANAGKRVPIDPGFCRPTRKAESAETGSDGQDTAAATFLPEFFTSELRQAAAKADEITADMRTLVRRTNEAGCFQ